MGFIDDEPGGFNRTFQELKYGKLLQLLFRLNCFNRTFQELKFKKQSSGPESLLCFNRTFQELK